MGSVAGFFKSRFVDKFKKILEAKDLPQRIARGVAIGSFIAVTPTIGLQSVLALLVATCARANRAAALAMTVILNPIGIIPPGLWYLPAYYLGTFLLRMDPVGFSRAVEVYESPNGVFDKMGMLWSLGTEVYGPLLLGGMVMGTLVGLLMYFISLRLVLRYAERRGSATGRPRF